MSDGLVRLFVALELPEPARGTLAAWGALIAAERRGVRAVAAPALHVTLCFLGSRDVEELERIAAACEVVSGAPAVELSVGAGLCLPPRRPRVLAVGLQDPGGALGAIQATLSAALVASGVYRPERRRFLPHVTVARVRVSEPGILAAELPDPPALSLTGAAITLYRSRLGSGPARYEPLRTVRLVEGRDKGCEMRGAR